MVFFLTTENTEAAAPYNGPQKLDRSLCVFLMYTNFKNKDLQNMKMQKRTPELKLQVALEAIKAELSIAQIAAKHGSVTLFL